MTEPHKSRRWTVGVIVVLITAAAATLSLGATWGLQTVREENRRHAQVSITSLLAHEIEDRVIGRLEGVTHKLALVDSVVAVAEGRLPTDDATVLTVLNTARSTLGASLVYVLDRSGTVVACTPFGRSESLTGNNYSFRPYVADALAGRDCVYPALGVTTNVRGLYFSSPVYATADTKPIGVLTVKVGFAEVDQVIAQSDIAAALVSPDGVVLSTNQSNWLYRAAFPLTEARRAELRATRQFGDHPLEPLDLCLRAERLRHQGREYATAAHLVTVGGWRLITAEPTDLTTPLTDSQLRLTTYGVASAAALVAAVFALAVNVVKRHRAERALREINDSLESRVAERTAELAVANDDLRVQVEERRRVEEQLRTSERRLADIIDFLPDAAMVIDEQGRVTAWNRAMEELTGIRATEILGHGDYEYALPFYGQRRPILVDFVRHPNRDLLLSYPGVTQHGDTLTAEVATPLLASGARVVWVAARRLCDSAGDTIGAIETIRDITERKRAQRELERAKQAAEAASRAKSEFVANLSHEIRTPMTAILGFADTLAEGCQQACAFGSDHFGDHLNAVRRNGVHLLQIINDILDLARVESGHFETERIRCSPTEIVAEVCTRMRQPADAKGLELSAEFSGPIPESIETDPTRLNQILVNLVGNAIKFTRTGSVRIVTRLLDSGPPDSSDWTGRHLEFQVIDTGIGLAPAELGTLFKPFTQANTSATREYGGTGLGLVMSRHLARLLGGDVTATSTVGHGSTFRATIATGSLDNIRLAVPDDDARTANGKFAAVPSTSLTLDGDILLVEDGVDNQRLLTFLIKRAGARVTVAENGDVACRKVAQILQTGAPLDLVLMDMQMPVMDGYAATRALRELGYMGPIVAITASAMEGDRARCLQAGCTGFLSKPVDRAEFNTILQRHLRPRAAAPAT